MTDEANDNHPKSTFASLIIPPATRDLDRLEKFELTRAMENAWNNVRPYATKLCRNDTAKLKAMRDQIHRDTETDFRCRITMKERGIEPQDVPFFGRS
jgi:hypothetical protein